MLAVVAAFLGLLVLAVPILWFMNVTSESANENDGKVVKFVRRWAGWIIALFANTFFTADMAREYPKTSVVFLFMFLPVLVAIAYGVFIFRLRLKSGYGGKPRSRFQEWVRAAKIWEGA